MNKVVSQLLCTMFLQYINILADFVPFQIGNLKFQLLLHQFSHFLRLIYRHTLVFLSFINLSRHFKRYCYLIIHKVLFLSPFIHCCCQERYNGLTIVGGDFLSRVLHRQKILGEGGWFCYSYSVLCTLSVRMKYLLEMVHYDKIVNDFS